MGSEAEVGDGRMFDEKAEWPTDEGAGGGRRGDGLGRMREERRLSGKYHRLVL